MLKSKQPFSILVIIFLTVILIYLYQKQSNNQKYLTPKFLNKENQKHKKPEPSVKLPSVSDQSLKSNTQNIHLPLGTVAINDISGNLIARMTASVSLSGWVAIPANVCIGGYSWHFLSFNGKHAEIIGGIIGDQEEIGLWQLENRDQFHGPALSSGKIDKSFKWVSIISERSSEMISPSILSEKLNFYHVSVPESINEPGVFMQNGCIVGWSFGKLIDGGYIWKGTEETNLVSELSVSDYYRLTFEGGREEQFIMGYSTKDTNPFDQLKCFANGFHLEPKLSEINTPSNLRPEAAISQIHLLITQLLKKDYLNDDIAALFDSNIISKTGDVSLLKDIVNVIVKTSGTEKSINLIEAVLNSPENFNQNKISTIKDVLKDQYKSWLSKLYNKGEYSKGIEIFNRANQSLPNDPDIQLTGARLLIALNDWAAAEHLINTHEFPIDMTDQVKSIEEQISELKNQDNKIMIHFPEGSQQIPVIAVLNNSLNQNFYVDTGASLVTIPGNTAKQLGLNTDGLAPVKSIITAGGKILAPEVVIDSIQINGWTEKNVKALIIDMPDQSSYGLLGLNYLSRFRMDLNSKSGTLTMAPR